MKNVELGQHEGFLYHGPAFRPTAAGRGRNNWALQLTIYVLLKK